MTEMQRQLNKQVILLFFINLLLSSAMTIGSAVMSGSQTVRSRR